MLYLTFNNEILCFYPFLLLSFGKFTIFNRLELLKLEAVAMQILVATNWSAFLNSTNDFKNDP